MPRKSFYVSWLVALSLLLQNVSVGVAADPLPAPTNMACQGWERDSVIISWKDTASDESNYRVERNIDNAGWSEIATVAADGTSYKDTGIDTAKNYRYRVRSFRSGDSSFSPFGAICNNRRIFDPNAFRLFFGLRGVDDCPQIDGRDSCLANTNDGSGNNVFIVRQNTALQGSRDAFQRAGFTRDAAAPPSGLDKIPVNVVWCDGGGCAGDSSLGLSPMLLELPFDTVTRAGDPAAWIVAEHELFHFQQFKYGGLNDPAGGWVIEGQARSSQDKFCLGANRADCQAFDDIATGFAGYVPEVMGYLGQRPLPSINKAAYQAALFWTYLIEKFGTNAPGDAVEAGNNFFVRFWEESAANPNRDGIAIINSTLANLGRSERFRDIWKDFAVANFAKDISGSGVPAKYRYADVAQPGGNYGAPAFSLDRALNLGDQVVDTDESLPAWSARYYAFTPAADLPVIDFKVTQDTPGPMYYTLLAIKNNNLVVERNFEQHNLSYTLLNNAYDRVVLIVASLENLDNYRLTVNATQPSLRLLTPTTGNKARVGSPAAPDKFRVTLEVVAADGSPLDGVDRANFSFRVGAVDVPAANILTSATVQGQQWFVLRAPGQTAAGQYDLTATYGTVFSDTETLAVDYTPRNDADSVLVIDRSGSMLDFNKMQSAKDAARLYVDSWRTGDRLGVVTFANTVSLDMAMVDWTDTPSGGSRQTAFNAINAASAGGGTAIGDGVRRGWNEVAAAGNASHDWAIVLLSDGLETAGTETFNNVVEALRTATGKKPVIHAIAVGPDADRLGMQNAAVRTGGTYQYVSTPATGGASLSAAPEGPAVSNTDILLDMDLRYRAVAAQILGQQQFLSLRGPLADGDLNQDIIPIQVENGTAEMVLSLSWALPGVIPDIQLTNPNNVIVSPFHADARHVVWRVASPLGGAWHLRLGDKPIIITSLEAGSQAENGQAAITAELLPAYVLQGALRSDVTMDVYFPTPVEERTVGVAMPIVASLTDNAPITGAAVAAYVQTPAGFTYPLALRDDGLHGDGAAGDGVYANDFLLTGQPGEYNVTVKADGFSPLNGAFHRENLSSFHLDSTGDDDGDGLPNEWETHYGTDPNVPDATGDPDHDGLPNADEWGRGTDPLNPDTDGGGESDATDANPLDPADDAIQPTWTAAYPGNGKVYVKYVLRPGYAVVQLYRGDNPNGPFTFLQQDTPGSGLMIDTAVTNGQTYCYIAIAFDGAGRRSAPLAPSCATPREDPNAPHGTLFINNGARVTTTPEVTLQLWATDQVDPESRDPDELLPVDSPENQSGVTEMLISNFADFHDAAWEPYATHKAWQLAQTSGLAGVFAKYRDAAGNESAVVPATIHVVAVGECDCALSADGWRVHLSDAGHTPAETPTLEGYLALVDFMSSVFDEARDVSSLAQAEAVLLDQTSAAAQLDRELLAVWLNFAFGAFHYDALYDFDGDGVAETSFWQILSAAEAVRLDPAASDGDRQAQTTLLRLLILTRRSPKVTTPILDLFDRGTTALTTPWFSPGGITGYTIVNNEVDVSSGGALYWRKNRLGKDQEAKLLFMDIDPDGREQGLLLKVQGDTPDWRLGAIKVVYDAARRGARVATYRPDTGQWLAYRNLRLKIQDGDHFSARVYSDGRVWVFVNCDLVGIVKLNAADQAFFNRRGGWQGVWYAEASAAKFDDFGGGRFVP